MSEQDLYAIASQRINRRNRRWFLWTFNLAVMIATVAGVVVLGDTSYQTWAVGLMLAWAGVFVPHTIINIMLDSRDEDIDKEVAKLRAAMGYEKPKRVALNDEGELVDAYEDEDGGWDEDEILHKSRK